MDVYALIIAGGVGARFWPRSKKRTPKQLLEIIGHGTMIQNTVYRLDPLIPKERILVITNSDQVDELRRQLPTIPERNILIEPTGRNTAPAIALGAEVLRKRSGTDSVMVVLPADHIVHDIHEFQRVLQSAITVAESSSNLVTLGITPTRPETGYGYIQFDDSASPNSFTHLHAYPVVTFAEKPNLATAQRFLDSGDFLWNSGMFIWKTSTVLNSIAEFLPDLSEEMSRLRPAIDTDEFVASLEVAYREMDSISVDYGVMEKAKNRYVIPSDFGWNDLGSWDEVFRIYPKDEFNNVVQGDVVLRDVRNSHISTHDARVIAVIGCEDMIVIDAEDALLICKRGRSQEVKEVVDSIKKRNLSHVL